VNAKELREALAEALKGLQGDKGPVSHLVHDLGHRLRAAEARAVDLAAEVAALRGQVATEHDRAEGARVEAESVRATLRGAEQERERLREQLAREREQWAKEREPKPVDLADLRFDQMEDIATTTPLENHQQREGLRQQLLVIAQAGECPDLARWAESLPHPALECLLNLGFSEVALLRSLTGNPNPHLGAPLVNSKAPGKGGKGG
jgi:hypothetical protein